MSRKSSKKPATPLVTGSESKPAGTAYPVDQAELDAQSARLKKAASAGAVTVKSSATPAEPPPAERPTQGASSPNRLSMLETLKPGGALPGKDPVKKMEQTAQSHSPQAATAAPEMPAKAAAPRPATPPTPQQTVVPAKASSPTQSQQEPPAPKTSSITFAFLEPSAKQVSVRGEFNGWSAEATPLKRQDDGHWETSVSLAPGRYEYKFFVDGEWVTDPRARENVRNQHGTLNSVIIV